MSAPRKKSGQGSGQPPGKRPARILICDDQKLIRTRVREILQQVPWLEVVGEVGDGESAVRRALELRPDVVLMDVSMPRMDGIEATRQIVAKLPDTRVLGFSTDAGEDTVRRMFAAGAQGYVIKSGDPADLLIALTSLLAGEQYLKIDANAPSRWPRRD